MTQLPNMGLFLVNITADDSVELTNEKLEIAKALNEIIEKSEDISNIELAKMLKPIIDSISPELKEHMKESMKMITGKTYDQESI
jgi:hypothetical protein